MTKQEFDLGKPWRLEDLPAEERSMIDEHYELEPNKWYVDFDGKIEEVPVCPYCGKGTWAEARCSHVVFEYLASDIVDPGYNYIHEFFGNFIIDHWIPSELQEDPDFADFLADSSPEEGELPHPDFLSDFIVGLEYRDVWYYWGAGHAAGQGVGYGYADEDLLLKIKKLSEGK